MDIVKGELSKNIYRACRLGKKRGNKKMNICYKRKTKKYREDLPPMKKFELW